MSFTALSKSEDCRVRAELVNVLYRHAPSMLVGACVACALVGFLLWGRVPAGAFAIWIAINLSLTAARMGLVVAYFRHKPRNEQVHRWAYAYAVFAGLAGIVWGALTVLFFNPADLVGMVILCILPAALMGGAVGSLAPSLPSYLAFVVPLSGMFQARMFIEGGETFLTIGVLGVIFLVMNFVFCLNTHRMMRKSIVLGFENLDLVRQLTEEKERAEAATLDKSRFLAAASHDLRQPIHALALFSAALLNIGKRHAVRFSEVTEISRRLQATVKHLGELLHSILDASHLDTGELIPKMTAVAVMDEFAGLHDKFSEPAAEKKVRLVVRPTGHYVWTDPIFLRRILWNLVSNSLRYTERGRVLVACRRRGQSLEIQVWDTGIGIPEDQQSRIFDDFYRIGVRQDEQEQGFGLGLAIVRRSAQLLNAPIKIRSVPGKGSMFSVTLPRCAAPELPSAGEFQATPEKLRILVIDDDAVVLRAMSVLLCEWGHSVVSAPDLESALASARRHSFDRILSDYRLGKDVTGIDAIRAIREQAGKAIPAVIISGDLAPDTMREISASGLRLLQKPIEPDELRLAIHSGD